MEKTNKRNGTGVYPLIRVITFGEFALERLVAVPQDVAEMPHYVRISPEEWDNRGPALTLLKVLLCRMHRRASRSELIATIWPDGATMNTQHALDSAASILRRRVLRTYTGESLLHTVHGAGDTTFKLSAQQALWVDADAVLTLATQSLCAASQGQNPLSLLEKAHALSKGEFLEDDPHCEWARRRRHTINGARRRILYKLVELYLQEKRVYQAEELLYAFLEGYPTDEDALCHLMALLSEQGRRQEALQIYNYTVDILYEEQQEPAAYTKELAARIQQGVSIKEQTTNYIVTNATAVSSFMWNEMRSCPQVKRKSIHERLVHYVTAPPEVCVEQSKISIELAPRRDKTSYKARLYIWLLQRIVLGISFYSLIRRWNAMRMEVDKLYYGNYKFEVELDTGAEVGEHQLMVWFAEKMNSATVPLANFKPDQLLKSLQEPYKSTLSTQLEQEKCHCRSQFKEEITDLQCSSPAVDKKSLKKVKRRIGELRRQMDSALQHLEKDFARRALLTLDRSCFDLDSLQKENHFFNEAHLLRDFYFEEANTPYICNFCRKFATNDVYRQQVLAREAPWVKRNALFLRNAFMLFGECFHPTDASEYENKAYELFHWIGKHYKEILVLPEYQRLQQVDNAFKANAVELDPAIRPAIELLNRIPGVTTRYSCQGVSGKVQFQGRDVLVVSEHEEYAYVSFSALDQMAKRVSEALLPQFPHITNAPIPGKFVLWSVLRSTGDNIRFRAELFELAKRVLDEITNLRGSQTV